MNRLLKAAAISVMVLIGAQQANAAPTSFVTPTYYGEGTSYPRVAIVLPACASGDTVSFIMNTRRVLRLDRGGNTTAAPYFTMITALGAQAAGDSVSVAIDAGVRPLNYSPGWVAVDTYASWLNTVGGNTTFGSSVAAPVKVANVIASTIPPGPLWRVRILTKSTIAAGTHFEIGFPQYFGMK